MVIMLLICLVLFLIAKLVIDESVFSNLGMLFSQAGIYTNDVTAYLQDPAFIQAAASISGIVVLGLTVMVVVGVMYTLIFALTPYVLEKNKIYGNCADDMVEQYDYDIVYENNMPLEQAERDFMIFFENNVLKC